MAFLAAAASHKVNGVAALHSMLIKEVIFKDFVNFYGDEKFTNVTNGITPRRWLHQSNPLLSELITKTLGSQDWLKNLTLISGLKKMVDDVSFQKKWMDIKYQNKVRLAELIQEKCHIKVSADALFDIQCKRLHEYKRQLMNVLHVIHRYKELKTFTKAEDQVSSSIFSVPNPLSVILPEPQAGYSPRP